MATTAAQAHEWKRTRSHVQALGAIAAGLERGLIDPARAVELLVQHRDWLEKDINDLENQAIYREAEAEAYGKRYTNWLHSLERGK